MSEKKPTIEENLEKIEQVIAKLNKEDLPLEDALKAYEEGIGLVNETNKALTEAEKRLQVLSGGGQTDEL
ncbi:MAG: exodeoxyribonuclease VII small subunit [Lachnospiraceae bacterium]|nr:exodeoxyribonuclease VII small subunit [Lachnospiraceae bacterium]